MRYSKLLTVPFLLCTVAVFGQLANTLTSQFENYSKHVLQEKVFVHTDRASYLTGETIWLKLYYRDASYLQPLNLSKVGYVEIVDSQNKPVIQSKIGISEKGSGSASIYLPVTLSSGNYMIRAYTNWMKNFSNDQYFQQQVTIINPFSKLGLKPATDDPEYDLQLLPEGGYLVRSLESVVGFRVVDKAGRGKNLKCAVVNENNDTVTTFRPFFNGIGRFRFKPENGHTYRVVIQGYTSKKANFIFPEIKDYGFVVEVKDTIADKISVHVKVTSAAPIQNPTVYCVVQNKHQLTHNESQFLVNGERIFLLDKSKVNEGISHITVFDSELNPVCERLYYKDIQGEFKIQTSLNQQHFTARKKVEINIQPQLNASVTAADLSIAVYKVDSTEIEPTSISSYLNLTSELKGSVETPEYYLSKNSDANRLKALDNLLLTHGWSRYHWNDIRKPVNFEFLPEVVGHLISASVTSEETGLGKEGVTAFLSAPGKNSRLYISKSENGGTLLFDTQFYGQHEIVVQTNTTVDSTYKIKINSPFSEKPLSYQAGAFDVSETLKRSIEQRSLHMQVLNIFHDKELDKQASTLPDTIPFFGKADEKYRLDDFTRFPTMEEVMREYVVGVLVRKHKGKFHFLTLDDVNKTVFRYDPLILLDGIPVFETDKIMAFDPKKVSMVEVIKKRYYLGSSSFDGVVNYKTYNGDLAGFEPDKRSLVTNYDGLQQAREFFSPKYESQQQKDSRMADTRNLLYWSPEVALSKDGKGHVEFYTSDVYGKFKVVIQGITPDGHATSESSTFDVESSLNY